MVAIADYNVKEKSQWCPGCGNFAIVGALKGALADLQIPQHQAVIVSGIGCSSKLPHYVNTYGFESLHGSGHFLHIMRRNYDLTYIVHDNQIYGLTTGQASPTSQLGMKTKTTPYGVVETPFNPLSTAINGGATFVARAFAGDMAHMKEMFKQAIAHRGFALVDVFQPCVTFNKLNTYDFFTKRVYKLESEGHDTADRMKALEKAYEQVKTNYERLPIGVFFKEERPTYEDTLPQIKEKALVEQSLASLDISAVYPDME
jgi:2-oxoglutarate ferredoxin oxidoreductase subunit beta